VALGRRMLMPGLINAHTHTPMTLFRGFAEGFSLLTMEGWYRGIREWELSMSPDMVPPAVSVSCAEMIRTGTTCFADQYFYMDRIVPAVRASGLRAALACVMSAVRPPQLLILDEPTNHLDLDSVAAVEAALVAWDGAIIVVSHDPDFLAAIGVERTVALVSPRP